MAEEVDDSDDEDVGEALFTKLGRIITDHFAARVQESLGQKGPVICSILQHGQTWFPGPDHGWKDAYIKGPYVVRQF